jgi:hypothetical protein
MKEIFQHHRHALVLALLSVVLSFGSFFVGRNIGIDLADEGYLWYGTRAVADGQVPIRDFQAYDPGRYYWTAAWSVVLGDDLVAMRASCVLFQCLGVFAGLLVMRRLSRDWKFLLPVAVILVLWMAPYYKVFEQSIALMAIYAATLLIEAPTIRRHFYVGMFMGLMAFMGRNHGLYQFAAFGMVILLLAREAWRELPRRLLGWVAGIAVGYLPQLLMLAFVPGYFTAFVALLTRNVSIGSNVAMPVPWPWSVPADYGGIFGIHWVVEGLCFLAIVGFIAFSAGLLVLRSRVKIQEHAVFVAAACVVTPYAHHTFSRSDYVHLAHSMPGLCIGILAACFAVRPGLRSWLPKIVAIILLVLSVMVTSLHTPALVEAVMPKGAFVEVSIAGRTMRVPGPTATWIRSAQVLAYKTAKPDEPILFVPHWPGLYPVTNRRSPVQHLYFTRPTPELDVRTLDQMKKSGVKWVMVQDRPLDGRDDLRFRCTNPVIFQYLLDHYVIRTALKGQDWVVMRLKEPELPEAVARD